MMLIQINKERGIPKYQQIIESVENAITDNILNKEDKLPSINSIRNKYAISRDTVLLAYNDLKIRGIIRSIPGKGYYVKSESINVKTKIFLLFDELNVFKEDLYNSFITNLESNVAVDIFFHHFNHDIFNKLIHDNNGDYNYYVIMPANLEKASDSINYIPSDKVIILDQMQEDLIQYPGIYQNFEKDIFNGLTNGIHRLKRYNKLVLLFQKEKQPQGMLKGFKAFCKMNAKPNEIIDTLKNRTLEKGEIYLIPDDRNLILIIKKIKEQRLILGSNIGIISYNDTLLKEVVEDGITTISTDFNEMGKRLAQMIIKKERVQIENSCSLILRNSL